MGHTHAKLIIIGSGPAGYTAAVYAARAMLEPMLISGFQPGGQLMITTDVENYPGFADVIQGPWLMEQMRLQAEHVGTRMISDHVVKVELGSRPFRLEGDSGDTYSCDALVIATGAQAKWLGLPSEAKFQGFGVSACATCDGFFFRGKEVVVVGGGDVLLNDARADMLGLEAHLLHEPGPLDHVREARVVLDVRRDHELTARLEAGDHHGFEQGARRIDRRRIACWPRADDDELGMRVGHQEVSSKNAVSSNPRARR